MLFALSMQYIWIDGYFVTIFANGDIELYSEGDITIPLKTWKKIALAADKAIWDNR